MQPKKIPQRNKDNSRDGTLKPSSHLATEHLSWFNWPFSVKTLIAATTLIPLTSEFLQGASSEE